MRPANSIATKPTLRLRWKGEYFHEIMVFIMMKFHDVDEIYLCCHVNGQMKVIMIDADIAYASYLAQQIYRSPYKEPLSLSTFAIILVRRAVTLFWYKRKRTYLILKRSIVLGRRLGIQYVFLELIRVMGECGLIVSLSIIQRKDALVKNCGSVGTFWWVWATTETNWEHWKYLSILKS